MNEFYDIFITNNWKTLQSSNRWSCSDVALALLTFLTLDNVQTFLHCTRFVEKFLRSSFGVPLVLLWLFYRTFSLSQMSNGNLLTLPWRENAGAKEPTLKWFPSAFFDERSGRTEREENSKVMRRYALLTDICRVMSSGFSDALCCNGYHFIRKY